MTSIASIPRKLPLLLVTEDVLLPGSSIRVSVTSSANINMVKSRLLSKSSLSSSIIGVLPKEPGQFESDDIGAMHNIGTAALVVQVTGTNWPRPSFTLLVTGLCRFRLDKLVMEVPYPVGVVTQLDKLSIDDEDDDENPEFAALVENFRSESTKLLDMLDVSSPVVARLKKMLNSIPHTMLADLVASLTKASFTEKLEILDAIDLMERFKKALPLLVRQVKMLEVIRKGTSLESNPGRRMIMPFQNIADGPKTSKRSDDEMDGNSDTNDLLELQKKLKEAKLPQHARKIVIKDLQRLKRMGPFSPEHGVIRSWLELIADLPWAKASQETLDIHKARKDLDADHYAMDKLKRRVLEYLAVRQLKNTLRGPILCFVGPPGVGKTSVGRSIANTLGREFYRISLGGICNQSDIRGHRRTYIGSMPGRIIQGLKVVGVNNPVFLLDEIDKMGSGIHGDPASALLEVLDPEQNCSFVDHYLNVPFDLSQVMFIATANTTKSIPAPLLDRMELIHVPGYTQEEKMEIAEIHLLPKQLREHGLDSSHMVLPQDSLKALTAQYTREAGVRTLERKLGALCRAVAVQVAEMKLKKTSDDPNIDSITDEAVNDMRGSDTLDGSVDVAPCAIPPQLPIILDEAALEDILGPPIYDSDDIWSRLGVPGVAVGLSVSLAGGNVMMVEASKMEGDGEIVLTGQLGNVMQESAHLALNWVRTASREYGLKLDGEMMSHTDIHIHFPAGSVGKDGPSAGVTIATALVSLFSGRPVASDVAMTGEITLRGIVLPVGGIKEKVLAAHRAGMRRVIIPKKCEKDLVDVPDSIKKDLFIIPVSHVDEVLQAAFEGGFHANVQLDQVRGAITSKL
ncbi:lon protease homolog 2, peroxisomal isoform X1 [Frankliniella occidentalis]|uniref:Lon protease homolog n=1 Tax=Frankliniella occidentalis TaxID=133901 RepID=A0A6J1T358_FRAOC|nr:lon protease homolog 2, peroxisomal isoform X1 [Frankliniella occidentalis]